MSECLSGIFEGKAVSNQSSLQAHSTTPGVITQRSAHGGCDKGSSDNPAGSRLRVSNESTQQNPHTQGPRKYMCSSCLVWHTPPPRLARNWNSYLLLCLWSPTFPPTQHITLFSMARNAVCNVYFQWHLIQQHALMYVQTHTLLSVSSYWFSLFYY